MVQVTRKNYFSYFADLRLHVYEVKLLATTFDVEVEIESENYQTELIEMQFTDILRSKSHSEAVSVSYFHRE